MMEEMYHAHNSQKKSRLSIFNIKVDSITENNEHHFMMVTGHKKGIQILNSHAPNDRVSSIKSQNR